MKVIILGVGEQRWRIEEIRVWIWEVVGGGEVFKSIICESRICERRRAFIAARIPQGPFWF